MDLRQYFSAFRQKEAELASKNADGVVFITSIFNREKNSTDGCTMSASVENAARTLTDGTHRLATEKERKAFLALQEKNKAQAVRLERERKQQFVTFIDRDPADAALAGRSSSKKG